MAGRDGGKPTGGVWERPVCTLVALKRGIVGCAGEG